MNTLFNKRIHWGAKVVYLSLNTLAVLYLILGVYVSYMTFRELRQEAVTGVPTYPPSFWSPILNIPLVFFRALMLAFCAQVIRYAVMFLELFSVPGGISVPVVSSEESAETGK